MKKYMNLLTQHLKELAKLSCFSYDEREVNKIYNEKRDAFLQHFFKKLAQACDARFATFEEKEDHIFFSVYFGDNYPSNYNLYPFYAEVSHCVTQTLSEEHLEEVELAWINQLSEAIGPEYDCDLEEFEATKINNVN